MKKIISMLLVLALSLALFGCGQANSGSTTAPTEPLPPLQVGYGRTDISPEPGMPLRGYGNTSNRLSDSVTEQLFTTCIAITDETGKTILLYHNDLCNTDEDVFDKIREDLSAATGVPFEQILVPAALNREQLAMFEGLNIKVEAAAIQADNMHSARFAFEVLNNEGNVPAVIADDAALKNAIAAGETELWLDAGTFHMPAAAKGKTLVINGAEGTVIEVVPAGQGEANGQLDYNLDGSTVTFNNVTIKTNSNLYAGYARMSGTYNDCVIQNTYNLAANSVNAFNNCVFNITNEYLRVGGASSAVFNGCTFNTDGRAILVYQDGTNLAQTVTVKDCTFNATATAMTWNGIPVAAVSIDGTSGTYTVNLEGNNVVDADFNGLWQIKAGGSHVTVNEN